LIPSADVSVAVTVVGSFGVVDDFGAMEPASPVLGQVISAPPQVIASLAVSAANGFRPSVLASAVDEQCGRGSQLGPVSGAVDA